MAERTGKRLDAPETGASDRIGKCTNQNRSLMLNLTSDITSDFAYRARDEKQRMVSILLHRHEHATRTKDASDLTQVWAKAVINNVMKKQVGNHSIKAPCHKRHFENIAQADILHLTPPDSFWRDVQSNEIGVGPNVTETHSVFTVTTRGDKYVVGYGKESSNTIREVAAGNIVSHMIPQDGIKRPTIKPVLCKVFFSHHAVYVMVKGNFTLKSDFSGVHAPEHITK